MTLIKICGITNKIDALEAAKLKVDMVGFVFYKKSKRYVDPKLAEDIINELPASMEKVGVFVDEEEPRVLEIAEDAGLTMLQFHGDEAPGYCGNFRDSYKAMKAFRLKDKNDLKKINDYDTDFYLLDNFKTDSIGGTGESFDWKILKDFEILRPVILAGGLNSDNVGRAIKEIAPFGVDVSTGVEKFPGKKDPDLMKKFVENVRKID